MHLASKITIRAFEEVVAANLSVLVGLSELELVSRLEEKMFELGATGTAFPTIVASGTSSAEIHHIPTDKSISPDILMIDMGAEVNGQLADYTWTLHLGSPDEKYSVLYSLINSCLEKSISEVKAGKSAKELAIFVNDLLGEEMSHALGHGVEQGDPSKIHAKPLIHPRSEDTLEEGQIITIEPALYYERWGGIRLEEMLKITKSGCIRLKDKV
ncbi:MAG: M24 family metallopeptidase [Candidatus Dojkabacteria bacterium]